MGATGRRRSKRTTKGAPWWRTTLRRQAALRAGRWPSTSTRSKLDRCSRSCGPACCTCSRVPRLQPRASRSHPCARQVERDYAALVTPLLEGELEHARYTRCWRRLRRIWRRLRRQPVGAHPRHEALPELLQALLSAWGGAAAVSAAVFADAEALEGPGLQARGGLALGTCPLCNPWPLGGQPSWAAAGEESKDQRGGAPLWDDPSGQRTPLWTGQKGVHSAGGAPLWAPHRQGAHAPRMQRNRAPQPCTAACSACAPRTHRSVPVRVQALETSELSRRVAALAQSSWVAVAPAAAPVAAAALARRAARRSARPAPRRSSGR